MLIELHQSGVIQLDDRDNIVDHVVCLKAEFLWHTVLLNENDEFYTYGLYGIYIRTETGRYLFNGIAHLMKV